MNENQAEQIINLLKRIDDMLIIIYQELRSK